MQFDIQSRSGDHVKHIKASEMEWWQKEYATQDIFDRTRVFVPADQTITCILFRMQHRRRDPTHWFWQGHQGVQFFVPLRELYMGEELCFDYFGGDDDDDDDDDDTTLTSQTSLDTSLGSLSGSPIDLTGNGQATTAQLLRGMEERVQELNGVDNFPSLSFDCGSGTGKVTVDGHFA